MSFYPDEEVETLRVLIQRALTWREGIELDALDETLDLVRYTIESGQK
ncbi:hypothetical protein [Paenibacillus sp. V4I5]|nr:hypothetical protein [Paenibacillus sp. V4I5]MDQ0921049.1 hypothetical protein [Paenibacillus sp. V4I5]